MTSMTWLPDLEEELLPRPPGVPVAPLPTSAPVAPEHKATGPGAAEIKKHNKKGIYGGLMQLRRSGEPARRVQTVPLPTTTLIPGPWFDLGVLTLVRTPVLREAKTEAQFGDAVEPQVRRLFIRKVVVPRPGGRKATPHDVIWDELADFCRELAAELAPSGGSFRF